MRPLCQCGQRPAAINYKKEGKTFYRLNCEVCLRHGVHHGVPNSKQSGYEKKNYCEKCGFKSKHLEQFNVFHVDGKLENCRPSNLKTICANCQRVLQKEGVKWKQGDLRPDF
jgi:tRNA(Ile)-lysidine synthase TilS/MesJ